MSETWEIYSEVPTAWSKDGKLIKNVTISGDKLVQPDKSVQLEVKVSASSGASKTLKWTVSNSKYATVTSKGVLKAKQNLRSRWSVPPFLRFCFFCDYITIIFFYKWL